VCDCGENWSPGADRLAACLKDSSADVGEVQETSANCKDLTVRSSSGGEYKIFRMGADYAARATRLQLTEGRFLPGKSFLRD
jgi:hypothetical protein